MKHFPLFQVRFVSIIVLLGCMIFRLCLVAVKRFPENTYFPEMLISGKGKCFHGVWLHFKKFSGKYFLVFGKEEGKHKFRKTQATTQIAPSDDCARDRDQRCDLAKHRRRSRSGAILPSRDRDLREIALTAISIRCDLTKARSRSRSGREIRCDRDLNSVARSGVIAISIRSQDSVRSRFGEIAIRCDRDLARLLCLSFSLIFRKYFEGKIEV